MSRGMPVEWLQRFFGKRREQEIGCPVQNRRQAPCSGLEFGVGATHCPRRRVTCQACLGQHAVVLLTCGSLMCSVHSLDHGLSGAGFHELSSTFLLDRKVTVGPICVLLPLLTLQ